MNTFEGDGALCVFGPPVGRPDHAGGTTVDAADPAAAACWRPAGEVLLRGRTRPTCLWEGPASGIV